MKSFKYSIFAQFIYRYANIPLSLLLIVHLLFLLLGIQQHWKFGVLAAFNIVILYALNRYYFKSYKLFPYYIIIKDNTIICSDFFFQRKIINIKFEDIVDINGGIFSGKKTKPIYIKDRTGNVIGVNQHLKDFNVFLTLLLSKVPKNVYDESLDKLSTLKDKRISSNILKYLNKNKKN